jgi:ubiquinone/menaquinone biosynthesis C-methylase UbiE
MNFYDLMMHPLEKKWLADKRAWLMAFVKGEVLEIGYGTGANFRFMDLDTIKHLTALDTSDNSGENTSFPIEFVTGSVESLPFADACFDTVIETLVLCSVTDLECAVSEIARVLKPGGAFVYMDHVLPEDKSLASTFKIINPLWSRVANGCQLIRKPKLLFEKYGLEPLEAHSVGNGIFDYGVAIKLSKGD